MEKYKIVTQKQWIHNLKSAHTWHDKFEFNGGSYSVPDIQDYFEYIIKKHEAVIDNPPMKKTCKWNRKQNHI